VNNHDASESGGKCRPIFLSGLGRYGEKQAVANAGVRGGRMQERQWMFLRNNLAKSLRGIIFVPI